MQGLLLHAIVTSASVQDRDGGIMLLATLFGMFAFLAKLFADSAYEGPIFHTALATILRLPKTEIVKRSDQAKGFVVLPNLLGSFIFASAANVRMLLPCARIIRPCRQFAHRRI
jgi:hypothetical protein